MFVKNHFFPLAGLACLLQQPGAWTDILLGKKNGGVFFFSIFFIRYNNRSIFSVHFQETQQSTQKSKKIRKTFTYFCISVQFIIYPKFQFIEIQFGMIFFPILIFIFIYTERREWISKTYSFCTKESSWKRGNKNVLDSGSFLFESFSCICSVYSYLF